MKIKARNLWRAMLVFTTSGLFAGITCTDQQLQAFALGLNAFAGTIEDNTQQDKDEDISFGNWLLDELDDL